MTHTTSQRKNSESKELLLILEELRRQSKGRHFTRANLWNEAVNKLESGLSRLSIAISVVLITFFTSTSSTRDLADKVPFFLGLFWLFLCVSIVCGFIHHIVTGQYFLKGARRESEAEKAWSKAFLTWDEYNIISDKVNKLYEDFKDNVNPTFLYAQFFLNLIALVLMISIYYSVGAGAI